MADGKYSLVESVGSRLVPVTSYESSHIHHPTANARGLQTGRESDFERPRGSTSYPSINGEHEEVRTTDGNQYVKKDMIFLENGLGNTMVPAPVGGYVYFKNSYGQADIYDKPKDQGGELIAKVMHLKPESFNGQSGAQIEYGQALGIQGQTGGNGRPDPANFGIHAHIEFNTKHLDQFDRYIKDVNSGVIAPGKYPAQSQPRPFSNPDDYGSLQVPASFAALHGQVDEQISRLYNEKGIDRANGFDNTVASCTVECVKQKVTGVQQASVGNGNIHLGQKVGFEWNVASVDATQAARTPVSESLAQLAVLDLQQGQQVDNPTQTQTKTQSGPTMR